MHTTLVYKKVSIKKERQCFLCLRKFPTKTKMIYCKSVNEGEFSSSHSCLTCEEITRLHNEDEYEEGYVIECLSKGQTPEDYLNELNKK